MFRRKKKHETLSDAVIAEEIRKTEEEKLKAEKEIHQARETISILNQIRKENHIVIDLREVFGGR